MKFRTQLYLVFSLVFLIGVATPTTTFAQSKSVYEVKAGDTFFSISKALKVSVAELKQWNNLSSNSLSIGQELVYYAIDEQSSSSPATEPIAPIAAPVDTTSLIHAQPDATNSYYLVKSGDTLYKIARDNNMSISELRSINNLTSDNLRIGQRLAVKSISSAPVVNEFSNESSPQGSFVLYTLEKKDNLNSLLSKFKMTETELQALNPEIDINKLNLAKKVTVLAPPSKNFANPYLKSASLQDLGTIDIHVYEEKSKGQTTTNGELYNPDELTAAHSNMSLGSIIFVENMTTGTGIYIRINDRITGSGLKLSNNAFRILGFEKNQRSTATIYADS
tara:strand:+ start:4777 stop:5781 length:1005 start_codon:yes stop_codon:yes gene_type:complete